MIRKLFAFFCAFCLLAALCPFSSAEMDGAFELAGELLTVRAPKGAALVFVSPEGEIPMENTLEDEEADGRTRTCWRLPEALRGESRLFTAVAVTPDEREGWLMLLCSDETGKLFCLGFTRVLEDVFVDCSEGYEYYEGRTLYVRLPGSPYTGYEWTCVPDDSGTAFLAGEMEVDMSDDPTGEEITETASGFFFVPEKDAPGREGSVMFERSAAPEDAPSAGPVTVYYMLDENGEFCDIRVEIR